MKKCGFLLLLILSCLVTGCVNKGDNIAENEKMITTFVDLCAFKELDDGWVAHLYIEIPKTNQKSEKVKENFSLKDIDVVKFNIINLKYNNIEGFYIPVKDEEGNEIDKMVTNIPNYIQSSKYGDKMSKISDFLTKKKYDRKITVDDLEGLDTKDIIDKEDIVTLYNDALTNVEDVEYPFAGIKESNLVSRNLNDGSRIQFAYISNFTEIGKCQLEYIYPDGLYLSDMVESGKADEKQIALQNKLDSIEEKLIETNEIDKLESTGSEELDKAIIMTMKEALGIKDVS